MAGDGYALSPGTASDRGRGLSMPSRHPRKGARVSGWGWGWGCGCVTGLSCPACEVESLGPAVAAVFARRWRRTGMLMPRPNLVPSAGRNPRSCDQGPAPLGPQLRLHGHAPGALRRRGQDAGPPRPVRGRHLQHPKPDRPEPTSGGGSPQHCPATPRSPLVITQGVRITGRCSVCGGVTTCDVGQFFDRGMLRWGTEGCCADCLNGWCEQDSGPVTPENIRQALLQAHGPAHLRLSGDVPSLVPVLQALRTARELSLDEARAQAAELAGTGLVGTLVEMEVLAIHLRRRAIAVSVEAAA